MKLTLTVTMVLLIFMVNAQKKYRTSQMGFGGLPIIYPGNPDLNGYSIRANAGLFMIERLSIGVIPFIGKVDDMKSFGASIYCRYYFNMQKLSVFLEGAAGFGKLNYELTPGLNGTMNAINIGPGINYLLDDHLALELILQYARLENISFSESTLPGNTLLPTIGIQYFLRK